MREVNGLLAVLRGFVLRRSVGNLSVAWDAHHESVDGNEKMKRRLPEPSEFMPKNAYGFIE
jgi:hypothetical protein